MAVASGKQHFQSSRCQQGELEILVKELQTLVKAKRIPADIISRTDFDFLARFLRVKDYDVTRALGAVHNYYFCVNKHRKLHTGIRPSQFRAAYDSNCYSILKHRFHGVRAGVGRIKHWHPSEVTLLEFQRGGIILAEQCLNDIEVQEKGFCLIIDFEGLRLEHLWHATIKEIRQCAEVTLKGLPIRIVGIHVVNAPSIFWPIYHIGKRFVKKKIHERIHFHDNFESLHKFFSKELLPLSLGGDLSEDDAADTSVIAVLLEKDIPYEKYWNGAIWNTNADRSDSLSTESKSG